MRVLNFGEYISRSQVLDDECGIGRASRLVKVAVGQIAEDHPGIAS
jgi:hypothetical protein